MKLKITKKSPSAAQLVDNTAPGNIYRGNGSKEELGISIKADIQFNQEEVVIC